MSPSAAQTLTVLGKSVGRFFFPGDVHNDVHKLMWDVLWTALLTSEGTSQARSASRRNICLWTSLGTLLGTSPVHSGRMRTTETPISDPANLSGDAVIAAAQTTPEGRPLATIVPGERLVLTVAETGELLGISRAFAYELVARGELPVIRLGRRIVVPKAALLAMVNQIG